MAKLPSKKRSKHRKPRREPEPDYVALGFRESARFLRRGVKEAKPYVKSAGKWAAPRAKKAAKEGAVLAGRGARAASVRVWDSLKGLRGRKHRKEMERLRQQAIYEGRFYMRPGHVVEKVEKRKK